MQVALFFIFATLAVAGAVNLLVQRAPINAALSLVAVMGALAVLYLLLGAEFIAFVQILVYAGAIMVLFVFVIMLLNAQPDEASHRSRVARIIGVPVLVALLVEFAGFLATQFSNSPVRMGEYISSTEDLGMALFHQYLLPFEVTSVLFLVGLIGAVLLAARREDPPAAMPTAVSSSSAKTTPAELVIR
ncbi:MAG: NADH-quinone oxidoreductase subunit J family protein [Terriglobales bacterium]